MRLRRRSWGLVRTFPIIFVVLAAHNTLLSQRLVKLSRLVCLIEDILRITGLSAILVGRSGELLSRTSDATEVSNPGIIKWHVNHAKRSERNGVDACRDSGLVKARAVGVDYVRVRHSSQSSRVSAGFGGRCFPLLGGTRSLLSSCIFFCKTLTSCLGLPIIITNSSAVCDDATSKLAEH
ncbi:hypothetical protein KCU85_g86, partial [Aureobasidium melanogenum]